MNLLVFIKATTGRVFGGYHSVALTKGGDDEYLEDPTAFIFSVNESKKFALKNDQASNAVYNSYDYGPTFGGGHDINVATDFNSDNHSTEFGNSYQLPDGI